MNRWQRRHLKRLAKRHMLVDGSGNRLLWRIIVKKALEAYDGSTNSSPTKDAG